MIQLASGSDQWLALRNDGTVVAWPTTANGGGMPDVPSGLAHIVSIAAGPDHNLALTSAGKVIAWGNASSTNSGACTVPLDLSNAVAIASGGGYSLALKQDGTLVGWGASNYPAPPASGVTAISASGDNRLAMALISATAGKPVIHFASPANQNVAIGSDAFLSISASGAPPLTYQWYFNGTNALAGATNRWLDLPKAQLSQSGQYSVVASNALGFASSAPIEFYVVPSLDITTVPAININGQLGATYRLEFIDKLSSLTNWTPLATVILTNSPQYYFDGSAIGQPARFYRAVQVP